MFLLFILRNKIVQILKSPLPSPVTLIFLFLLPVAALSLDWQASFKSSFYFQVQAYPFEYMVDTYPSVLCLFSLNIF